MSALRIAKWIGLWIVGTWVLDGVVRPALIAKQAQVAAKKNGKPLLNVGAGLGNTSSRALLLGPTLWGDINCDLEGNGPCGTGVCHCDVQNLPFADKQFGAVVASHVLEHVPDPQRAVAEMERVADEVFIITPKWWAAHTFLHPEHLWFQKGSSEQTLRGRGQWIRLRNRVRKASLSNQARRG